MFSYILIIKYYDIRRYLLRLKVKLRPPSIANSVPGGQSRNQLISEGFFINTSTKMPKTKN